MTKKVSVTCDGCGEDIKDKTPYYTLNLARPLVERPDAKMFQTAPDICDDCAGLLSIIIEKHSLKRWFYQKSPGPPVDMGIEPEKEG